MSKMFPGQPVEKSKRQTFPFDRIRDQRSFKHFKHFKHFNRFKQKLIHIFDTVFISPN